MDFQKAFDSVPRYILFQKLLSRNINGKFYNCLVHLYTEDKSCVKIGNKITNYFVSNQGVKQGCILSPTLFNIFLSDLQHITEQTECDPVQITTNKKLGCLIWADDLLLLSKSEIGLKHMLDELKSYTEKNGLTLNIKKTKAIIFNKSGRHIRRLFFFGDKKIETTRKYKYLGFMVTPSGETLTGLKDLKDRALKAFIKMKRKLGDFFRKCPQISLKLFNALVKHILLYASDFWGILKPPKNNPVENVHMNFCKQLLGVQKQTTNIGVLLELGEVPLNIHARQHANKNWVRIVTNVKCNEMVRKSYENAVLHKLTWPTRIESNLSEIGMRNLFLTKDNLTHTKAFCRMKDIFHQEAFSNIKKENSKLRTYSIIKKTIGFESYLNEIDNIQERISLTKFRLSNHSLMIEKGRHQNIEKECRFCPFCPQQVEDEMHFLLDCKCFSSLRNDLLVKIHSENQLFPHVDNKEKFVILMCFKNIIPITAQYIFQSFQIREYILEKHKNNI